jgi:hypothetical protein
MLMGKYISEHDAKIANKLAYAICGGDLSYPQNVTEQYLLDLSVKHSYHYQVSARLWSVSKAFLMEENRLETKRQV